MYNASNYVKVYEPNTEKLHEIRRRESVARRDEMARAKIKELEEERIRTGNPHKRPPVLVSRNMEKLPKSTVF